MSAKSIKYFGVYEKFAIPNNNTNKRRTKRIIERAAIAAKNKDVLIGTN